ncbi:thiolase family protein [Roseobacter sp.]|uniref:thiolase family protein n=1 Tax=Roseobacter sp. TaxID=1907202 RepID=UPI0029669102|nr:thiolase family protein [Roseobacter sp.]MDW3180822.1 thiolase family protein [Roseobacter sp.]
MQVRDVTVTGAALTPFNRRKDGTGFRDWALSAFEMALERSSLEHSDIDALYVASESDFFHLQLNPASVLATELGLTGVAATRCEGGGASGQVAVHAAARVIQAGAAKHVAVIGVDPSASSLSGDAVRTLYGFSFDAWTDGMTGLTSTALYALSFQAFASDHGIKEADLATMTLQNRSNACHNPGAHLPRNDSPQDIADSPAIASPYRRLHCSPLSDGAAAIILSRTDAIPRTRVGAARIAGMGAATDHMHLGARADPGFFTAKQIAMQRACAQAGATPAEIGLAELYDAYAGTQLQAIAALGLSEDVSRDLNDGAFAPSGRCAINLSGGLMGQGAPVGATGVGQTATCALLLEGRYHPALQPDTLPRYALADTHGGVCTLSAVTILERAEKAA